MFGNKCVELIKEASRETTDLILAYNKTLVDEVLNEMSTISRTLYEYARCGVISKTKNVLFFCFHRLLNSEHGLDSEVDRNSFEYRNRLLVNKVYLRAFLWNKRCLLAYQ